MASRDLVVDTDTTELNDDALALHYLFALGRAPDLITTVFGNSTAHLSARAAQELTRAHGLDVTVSAGAERPLCWHDSLRRNVREVVASLPTDTYLASLSADNDRFWGGTANDGSASEELAAALDLSRACDVLAIGPTTNIARAVQKLDPSVLRRHRLWVSGGALRKGNVTETAEFNAFADPDALRVCLAAAWERVTVVPLEVTSAPRLGITEVNRIRRAPTPLGEALDEFERRSPRGDSRDREPIWDVVAAVLLADETVPFSIAPGMLTVPKDPTRRGVTTFSTGHDVHHVVTAVDHDAVVRRFEDAVTSPRRLS